MENRHAIRRLRPLCLPPFLLTVGGTPRQDWRVGGKIGDRAGYLVGVFLHVGVCLLPWVLGLFVVEEEDTVGLELC